jgi:hypothetical protein
MPWSSERTLALKAAMSSRTAGVSGRWAGGSEYRVSRTEVGAAKLRCVSKKPTERNQGSGSDAMASTARGVTSDAWLDGTSTTSS